MLTAVDDLLYPSFMLGDVGAIAAVLTIVPDLSVALWDGCQRGDHATARGMHERIQPVWTAVNAPDMSARVKAAIELRGRRDRDIASWRRGLSLLGRGFTDAPGLPTALR